MLLEMSKFDIFLWILSLIIYFSIYVALFKDKFLNINKFDALIFIDIVMMFVPGINIAYILFKMGFNKDKYNFKNVYKFYRNYFKVLNKNAHNI